MMLWHKIISTVSSSFSSTSFDNFLHLTDLQRSDKVFSTACQQIRPSKMLNR